MLVLEQVNLQSLNTLGVPSRCAQLATPSSELELNELVARIHKNNCAWAVLGGGSNVLLPEFLDGLIIHQKTSGWQVIDEDRHSLTLRVAAGQNWHAFVTACVENHWYGLENLALIPGTVGAAPIQNIGAYGVEISSAIVKVEWLELSTQQKHLLSAEQCQFAYRDSIFKGPLAGQGIITHVHLRLAKTFNPQIDYPALRSYLELEQAKSQPSAEDVFKAVCFIRRNKLPDPLKLPNCGSFFKNPLITVEHHERLTRELDQVPSYKTADPLWLKIPAAFLIDQAGWKGKSRYSVAIHDQHALVIVNGNSRPLADVLRLANDVATSVRQLFSIDLEREPQLLTLTRTNPR